MAGPYWLYEPQSTPRCAFAPPGLSIYLSIPRTAPRRTAPQDLVERKGRSLSPSFLRSVLDFCDQHLEHAEPRVRSLVAGTLGALTRAGDTKTPPPPPAADGLGGGKPDEETEAGVGGGGGEGDTDCTGLAVYAFFRERLTGAISTNFERTKETITDVISGAENVAVDDTSGWKALETSLLALKVLADC